MSLTTAAINITTIISDEAVEHHLVPFLLPRPLNRRSAAGTYLCHALSFYDVSIKVQASPRNSDPITFSIIAKETIERSRKEKLTTERHRRSFVVVVLVKTDGNHLGVNLGIERESCAAPKISEREATSGL